MPDAGSEVIHSSAACTLAFEAFDGIVSYRNYRENAVPLFQNEFEGDQVLSRTQQYNIENLKDYS